MPKQFAHSHVDELIATKATASFFDQIPLNEIKVEQQLQQITGHRKSERRRAPRDIFLVFEEPSRRRRGGAAAKKSKFGHLKVEDPNKRVCGGGTAVGLNKSVLLRDIKNEPKCYLYNNNNCTIYNNNSDAANHNLGNDAPALPTTVSTKTTKTGNTVSSVRGLVVPLPPTEPPVTPSPIADKNQQSPNVCKVESEKFQVTNNHNNSSSASVSMEASMHTTNTSIATKLTADVDESGHSPDIVARVNPIFLWVKQEDTRIVEVRCEDYDKRNRIRITKTKKGWQAMPRTDPTSSRIVRFLHNNHHHNCGTPSSLSLQKAVKDEMYAAEVALTQSASFECDKQSFCQESLGSASQSLPCIYPLEHYQPLHQQQQADDELCDLNNISHFFNSFVTQQQLPVDENAVAAAAAAAVAEFVATQAPQLQQQKEQPQQEEECLVHEDKSSSLLSILKNTKTDEQQPTQGDDSEQKTPLWVSLKSKNTTVDDTTTTMFSTRRKVSNKKHNKKYHNKETSRRRCRVRNHANAKKVTFNLRCSGENVQPCSDQIILMEVRNATKTGGQDEVNESETHVKSVAETTTIGEEDIALVGLDTTKVPLLEDEIHIFSDSGLGSQEAQDCTTSSTPASRTRIEISMDDIASTKPNSKWSDDEIGADDVVVGSENSIRGSVQTTDENRTYHEEITPLRLCSKTGLFVHMGTEEDEENVPERAVEKAEVVKKFQQNTDLLLAEQHTNPGSKEITSVESLQITSMPPSSLLVVANKGSDMNLMDIIDTANLKDLLDGADMFCDADDNGTFDDTGDDVDFIDRLVKRSCESSLLQMHLHCAGTSKKGIVELNSVDAAVPTSSCENAHILLQELNVGNSDVNSELSQPSLTPSLLKNSSYKTKPMKCLSFNEAGEIEGINDGEDGGATIDNAQEEAELADLYENISKCTPSPIALEDIDKKTAVIQPLASPLSESTPHSTAALELKCSHNVAEPLKAHQETPKDLSYRSQRSDIGNTVNDQLRNQCAVTSTSDMGVIKRPLPIESNELHLPPLTVEVTTSETIKNLILEQFIKLNATMNATAANLSQSLTTATKSGTKTSESSSIPVVQRVNLRLQQEHVPVITPQSTPTLMSAQANHSQSNNPDVATTNFIETVLIDDEDEDENEEEGDNGKCDNGVEPLKKRMRKGNIPDLTSTDDPDPLTQLRLLTCNTQWKVPDPILVPKDRLGAVLASPAREIPLLITTRPELRLPEAFAYPEIIRNPNILVISMAQLEAILNNEMEYLINKPIKENCNNTPKQTKRCSHHTQMMENVDGVRNQMPANVPAVKSLKQENKILHSCTHSTTKPTKVNQQAQKISLPIQPLLGTSAKNLNYSEPTKATTSQPQDLNATTLAVLNQLLWLPYFGQLSHEFLKTFAQSAPMVAASIQPPTPSALPNTAAKSSIQGLTQLDELYKFYMNQLSTLKKPGLTNCPATSTAAGVVTLPTPPPSSTPLPASLLQPLPPSMHEVSKQYGASVANRDAVIQRNSLESALLQKLFENQMEQFLEDNETRLPTTALPSQQTLFAEKVPGTSNPAAAKSLNRTKNCDPQNPVISQHSTPTVAKSNCFYLAEKSKDNEMIKSDNRLRDKKPRLTCKSLSNLLEPIDFGGGVLHSGGYNTTDQSNVNTAAKLTNMRARKYVMDQQRFASVVDDRDHPVGSSNALIQNWSGMNGGKLLNQETTCHRVSVEAHTNRMTRAQAAAATTVLNPYTLQSTIPNAGPSIAKCGGKCEDGQPFNTAIIEANINNKTNTASGGHRDLQYLEANNNLWHPLFGSHGKAVNYTSPWQWTTVTASGE